MKGALKFCNGLFYWFSHTAFVLIQVQISCPFSYTDKLPGESAFRLFEPLTSKIGKKTGCNVGPLIGETEEEEGSDSEPESMAPVQVNKEQWYSTEEGMKLFSLMYRTFTEGQFEIVETSRDTSSQDIRLVLRYRQKEVRLEFPGNFPDSQVNVVREHGSNRAVSLQRDTSQEELAKELCEKLKGLFEGGRGMGSKSEDGGKGGKGRGKGDGGTSTYV